MKYDSKNHIIILLGIIIFSSIFTLSSCLTYNYDHIIERFMEYDDIDFNHITVFKITTDNKPFAHALETFLKTFFRNRGLKKRTIEIHNEYSDTLWHEVNFIVKDLNYSINEGWDSIPKETTTNANGTYTVYHNNVSYFKEITASIRITIMRSHDAYSSFDLTGDFTYKIQDEAAAIRTYRDFSQSQTMSFGIPSSEELAKEGLRSITETQLWSGICEKLFVTFLSKRMQLVSKEFIRFQVGYNKDFYKALDYLRKDMLDEALIIWQEIYADTDAPSYSRGVAAYNIAMIKTMEKDYDAANLYFNRSEELKKEGMHEFNKY